MLRPAHLLFMLAVLGAGGALPGLLAAQSGLPLRKGARVRLITPAAIAGEPDSTVRGRLVRLVQDTVIVRQLGSHGYQLQAFDLHGGRQLQVLVGTHAHIVRGVLVGAAAGAVLVGGIAYATYRPCQGSQESGGWNCLLYDSRETDTKMGAVLGGVVGSLIGLVIGSKHHGGHWVAVDTRGIRVSLDPGRHGLRVAFQL